VLVLQAMMDLNYLLTAVEMKNWSLSLLLVVVFQLIYILDFLIDEVSSTNALLSGHVRLFEIHLSTKIN